MLSIGARAAYRRLPPLTRRGRGARFRQASQRHQYITELGLRYHRTMSSVGPPRWSHEDRPECSGPRRISVETEGVAATRSKLSGQGSVASWGWNRCQGKSRLVALHGPGVGGDHDKAAVTASAAR